VRWQWLVAVLHPSGGKRKEEKEEKEEEEKTWPSIREAYGSDGGR